MNKRLLLLILIITFLGKTYACLNGESMILKNGTYLYDDREGNVPLGHHFYTGHFEIGLLQLDSLYRTTKDLDFLSDKGLLLILLNKYEDAIKLYLEIEKIQPNRYSTASNIGTAYELTGQNENALKWIKKSVKIDPKSHKNSEWIHVKILEAKIKGEKFYTTNFLLNIEFGNNLLPESQLTKEDLQKISDALYYQLNERISFVKPKEKIVAQLLFDLGNIAFLIGNYSDAKADYQKAKEYGFSSQLIENRIKEAERLYKLHKPVSKILVKNKVKSNYFIYGITGFITLTLITIFLYLRKRKNQ